MLKPTKDMLVHPTEDLRQYIIPLNMAFNPFVPDMTTTCTVTEVEEGTDRFRVAETKIFVDGGEHWFRPDFWEEANVPSAADIKEELKV